MFILHVDLEEDRENTDVDLACRACTKMYTGKLNM